MIAMSFDGSLLSYDIDTSCSLNTLVFIFQGKRIGDIKETSDLGAPNLQRRGKIS